MHTNTGECQGCLPSRSQMPEYILEDDGLRTPKTSQFNLWWDDSEQHWPLGPGRGPLRKRHGEPLWGGGRLCIRVGCPVRVSRSA